MFPRRSKSSFYASHETAEKIDANPADKTMLNCGAANFAGSWSMPVEKARARLPRAPLSA
jgi:hypothetical protein